MVEFQRWLASDRQDVEQFAALCRLNVRLLNRPDDDRPFAERHPMAALWLHLMGDP